MGTLIHGVYPVKKRNLFIAGGVLLVIVLVGLLPVFLSSGWMQDLLLVRVNSRISGTLSLVRCSIGWQQGFECRDVSYDDAKQGVHVDVPRVSGSQGLLALIVAPMNLGTVSMEEPVLVLPDLPPAVQEKSAVTAGKSSPPVSTPKVKEKFVAAATDTAPFWDKVNVKLLADRAVVKLAHDKAPADTFIRNCSLDARLATGSIHFEMELESGDGEGTASASGFVNLPARKGGLLDTLVTEINLHVMDLQIEHYLALVPGKANLPRGRGELSSELLIKSTGTSNLQVSGTNMLRQVKLAGGFLGEDQPAFNQVNLDLDVQHDAGKGWQLLSLQLAFDFGTLELAGTSDGQAFMANGKGRLDLPVLFAQLPHLLKVQPGTRLEDGRMDITINLVQDQQRLDVVAGAVVENISGMQQERPFAWNSRIDLNLDGSIAEGEARVGKLTIKAPFVNLEGEGDLKAFSMQGTADLGLAVQEIGKIFQLTWDGGGMLRLTAESKEKENNRYVVSTRMDIADFTLSHRGKAVVPRHHLIFSGRLTTPKQFPDTRAEAMDLVFDLSFWPGSLNGKLDTVYRTGAQVSTRYQLQSNLQLGRLTDLLHNVDMLNRETTLTGTMDLQAAGYIEENRLVVREIDSRIDDIMLYQKGKIFQNSSLHLFSTHPAAGDDVAQAVRALDLAENGKTFFARGGGCSVFDIPEHRIVLRDLGITSNLVGLRVARLSIEDWQQLPATLSLQVDGNTDLAELTPVMQQVGLLKSAQTLGGNGSFAVDLAAKDGHEHTATVKLDISHAVARQEDKTLLEDAQVHFSSRFQGNLSAGDIDFDTFNLQLAPLSLQAQGRLQRSGTEPYFSLNGEAVPDFASLATLLNSLYATDIRAAGRQQEKFNLYYPLAVAGAEKYRKLQFVTGLHAGYISHFGIDLQKPAMSVSMEKGLLQATLTGGVNNGGLKLSPRIYYTLASPLVTLPEGEQVLTDVQLEQALVDGVLKRINPVLGLLARPSGTISARMDRFSWPLADRGAEQADFSTVFNVSKIKLTSDGVLREILSMAGLGDEPLTLEQSEITCNGAQALISCTPLKILVADSEMILGGSVGFDGSLDYLLEVPVTKKLVGKEGYRVLKGTTLKVPIRGSSEQAIFDPDALSLAISDLLGQAAGQAAGKVIEEQVDKILPGLLDGLMGN